MKMWATVLTCSFLIGVGSLPLVGQEAAKKPNAEQREGIPDLPPVPDGARNQFDFLDGEWEFVMTSTTPAGDKRVRRGHWSGRKLAGGTLVQDSFIYYDDQTNTLLPTGIYTFRVFNRVLGKWTYKTVNTAVGVWSDGTGEKVGDEMRLLQTPPKEATVQMPMLRIRYYNIKPDRFSWVSERSFDGGTTWTPGGRIEARRAPQESKR
jgi:hypothetical protein